MAEKSLYLGGDPVSLPNGITTFVLNAELDDNCTSYVNAKGFDVSIADSGFMNVLGVLELPNGAVLFGRTDGTSKVVIKWYEEDTWGTLILKKTIDSAYIKSASVETVSAAYTYTYKNELVLNICFTKEDDIYLINLTTFDTSKTHLSDYMRGMILVPDIMYPTITKGITTGGLFPGTYQFAVRYKLDSGDYTNFSPLCPPITVCHSDASSYDRPTTRGIAVTVGPAYSAYKSYQIGIVKITPTTQEAFVTKELNVSTVNRYIVNITNTDGYLSIPLESILIKTIPVIGAEDCTTNNNRLLLANLKINSIDSDIIDTIVANTNAISFSITDSAFKERMFQINEMYIFYLAIYDIKGTIFTTIPISNPLVSAGYGLGYEMIGSYGVRIKLSITTGIHKDALGADVSVNLQNLMNLDTRGQVGGYSILIAEHNETNSIVLSHALAIRDGYEFKDDNRYSHQHFSPTKIRVYPFEYLYNRQNSISCNVQKQYSYFANGGTNARFELLRAEIEGNPHNRGGNVDNFDNGFHGQVVDHDIYATMTDIITPVGDLKFIPPLNESENNVQGDSYFRCEFSPATFMEWYDVTRSDDDMDNQWDEWRNAFPLTAEKYGRVPHIYRIFRDRVFKVYLYNKQYMPNDTSALLANLYGDLSSQKLAIASPFIPRGNRQSYILSGDSYMSVMAVRVKSPSTLFNITHPEGGAEQDEKDTKTGSTNQIILKGTVISKYNLEARYQEKAGTGGIVVKNATPVSDLKKWANYKYEYDTNFGHTDGDIYSKTGNENGIEYFPIKSEADNDKIHIVQNRIISSDVISSESVTIGWRNFRPTSYSDIDSSKGPIVKISASDKQLYIQCKYGLKVNSVKDVLNLNEAENTYLGTGDLFDRQSVEILYSPIGYIGCSHKNHCYYSVFGYIVIDALNAKIFLINESGVHCLSDRGINDWCKENIRASSDYTISVDQSNKILYIHCNSVERNRKNDYDATSIHRNNFDGFTLSYNFTTNTFIGFHSWLADRCFCTSSYYMLPDGQSNRTTNRQILKLSNDTRGVYSYDGATAVYSPTVIKTLFSNADKGSQLLKSVLWDTKHYSGSVINDNKTFDSIFIHTANQATDRLVIDIAKSKSEWWNANAGSNQKELYEFSEFKDILKDRTTLPLPNLLTSYKPTPTLLDPTMIWFNKSAFIGMYFFVVLEYVNSSKRDKFIINSVMVDVAQNHR